MSKNPFVKTVQKKASRPNPFVRAASPKKAKLRRNPFLAGGQINVIKDGLPVEPEKKAKDLADVEIQVTKKDPNAAPAMACSVDDHDMASITAKRNPFLKTAIEFQRSDYGERMKEISNNMVFPEGQIRPGEDFNSKGTGTAQEAPPLSGEKPYGKDRYYDYDTVDRKEMRKSPDPKQIIPGYEDWWNKEVSPFYDGWLENHIEASGGKIVGSNTDKDRMLNLKKDQRAHDPIYPDHAPTEKLLETRHHFIGDTTEVVASATKKTVVANEFAEVSEDKMKTTEQRLDDEDQNPGERIHGDYDRKNEEKRTKVHGKGANPFVQAQEKKNGR